MRYVYALLDPRDDRVRYVGTSTDPWARCYLPFVEGRPWQSHVAASKLGTTRKDRWIAGLVAKNLLPKMVVLDFGDWTVEDTAAREIEQIAFYRSLGELLNISNGGEQTPLWKFTDEMRETISRRTREAMSDPEVRKKCSEAAKRRIPWNKGLKTPKKTMTEEERAASYAARGEKIAEAARQRWASYTLERRAEIGASMSAGRKVALKGSLS